MLKHQQLPSSALHSLTLWQRGHIEALIAEGLGQIGIVFLNVSLSS
ncbi:hypothetical protein [uncultured Paraglaciecola sp.]|nr:hypothetical protein [uncultured Paraglaciecola sp.]